MTRRTATIERDEMSDLVDTAEADGEHPPMTGEEIARQVFGDDIAKKPVILKLARIMADLPTIQPEGRNQHFGYGFIKDTQISGALRGRMAREGLMVIPDVESEEWVQTTTARGGVSWVTKMKINFTVIDGASGDSISGHGFGYGDDAGDKGANKAFTAALKYWLMKLFQIGGEDSESDTQADERAAGRQAGSASQGGVTVQGREITGVARGGRTSQVTTAQVNAIFAAVKQLEWNPEQMADFINQNTAWPPLHPPVDGDPKPSMLAWAKGLDADTAGAIISALMTAKDDQDADDIPDDTDS